MEIITTHLEADFDGLASMVAAHKLYPEAHLVLPAGAQSRERAFLAEHPLPLTPISSLDFQKITRLILVDAQHQDRLGPLEKVIENHHLSVHIFDHHPMEASNQTIPSGQPLPQRPDMLTRNIGLSFAYAFNHNQFSLRAPYIFTERQKVSKGSWLVGYTFSSFTLSADSAFVPRNEWSTWGKGATIEKARFTSLGFAPGYTHTFVYNKFFLNLLLVFGPAHYWVRYTEQENKVTDDIRIDFYSGGRVGVGYSGDKFFGGINLSTQTKNVNFDESRFRNNTSVFRIVAGMRIREIGILKKGAIDILKGK